MKRLIYILPVFILVLLFSTSVSAQDVVQASAEVIQDVTYTKETDLDFGTFTTSFTGTATIDPTGGTDVNVNGTRGTDYFAGKIFISGAANQDVTVTHGLTSVTLNNSVASTDFFELNPITMAQTVSHDGNNGGGSSLSDGGTVNLDGSGQATVWIGGDLTGNDDDGDGSMAADIYENTTAITFTIDYTF